MTVLYLTPGNPPAGASPSKRLVEGSHPVAVINRVEWLQLSSGWTMDIQLSPDEFTRYSRNILLPQIGVDGQMRLKAASVLIVGLGGLGSPVALYLAAAGVGRLGLADPDRVELTNLQRQVIHTTGGIGQPKTASAREHLLELNPEIELDVLPEAIIAANAMKILPDYDLVVDATDNLGSRYLLNDACYFSNKTLIHGSIYRFEGQVSVFDGHRGACYRCVYPTPPPPELVPNGSVSGVMGVLPGLIGVIQATEALKLILGMESSLLGTLLLYNALELAFRKVQLHKNPNCPLCGKHPSITKLVNGNYENISESKEKTDEK
jgi:sulfur-carrier protein adenylyltransferase/sulfurtransferase